MYRKKTLRKMSPKSRKVARLVNELESLTKRLKNMMPMMQEIEFESMALRKGQPKIKEEKENDVSLFE